VDGWFASIASRTAATATATATKTAAATAAATATPVAATAVSTTTATAATRATRACGLGRAGAVESFGYAAVTGTEAGGCATWAVAAIATACAALGH
jgi:hypothetical protein